MAKIEPPKLDPRDEDEAVADAVSDLPAELTDRNSSSDAVKLIEACGAFYGSLIFYLNQIPERLYLTLLSLVGIERDDATQATVTLKFTAAAGKTPTIPKGTVVKTGTDTDAVAFTTDSEITLPSGGSDTVDGTAEEAGAEGNVAAGELTEIESPIAGVDSVTNDKAASGGQDEEPIDDLIDRAPSEIRKKDSIITEGDYVLAAENVDSAERALAKVDQGTGSITVPLLDNNLNDQGANSPLQTKVKDKIEKGTVLGTIVTVSQKDIRIIQVTDISVEYEDGADESETDSRIETALSEYLTAVDIFAADGSKVADGWPWGKKLFENEVVSLVDQLDGVERVGTIKFQTSDDYGSTWSSESTLSGSTDPGWDGSDDTGKGLFHWGGDNYSGHNGFNVTAL